MDGRGFRKRGEKPSATPLSSARERKKIDVLTRPHSQNSVTVADLQKELEEKNHTIDMLKREKAKYRRRNSAINEHPEGDGSDSDSEEDLRQEIDDLKASFAFERAGLIAQIKAVSANPDAIQDAKIDWDASKKLKAKENELKAKEKEVEELKNKVNSLKKNHVLATNNLTEQNDQAINNLKLEFESKLQQTIDEHEIQVSRIQKTHENYLFDFQQKLKKEFSADHAKAKNLELAHRQEDVRKVERELEILKGHLEEKTKTIADMKSEVAQAQGKVIGAEVKLKSHFMELDFIRMQNVDLADELRDLHRRAEINLASPFKGQDLLYSIIMEEEPLVLKTMVTWTNPEEKVEVISQSNDSAKRWFGSKKTEFRTESGICPS